jgi:hypothetical protein
MLHVLLHVFVGSRSEQSYTTQPRKGDAPAACAIDARGPHMHCLAAAFYFIPAQAMTKKPYPQHPPDRDLNSVKLVAGF